MMFNKPFAILFCLLAIHSSFSQNAHLHWVKTVTGVSDQLAQTVAVDKSGNVISGGSFKNTVDLDPGAGTFTLTSAAFLDGYLQKLTSNGNFIWAKQLAGNNDEGVDDLETDTAGNIYFISGLRNVVDVDPGPSVYNLTVTVPGSRDGFIEKLDASGNFIWALQLKGNESGTTSIKLDKQGNILVCGFFAGTVDFDPGTGYFPLTSNGAMDNFILKLDANGNFIWAVSRGNTNWDTCNDMGLDTLGNIYTIGEFKGTVDFDPGAAAYNLTSYSSGAYNVYISKLSSSGNHLWTNQIGGIIDDYGNALAVDRNGNVMATGYFQWYCTFNAVGPPTTYTSVGVTDIFVYKASSNGNFLWAKQFGGSGQDIGYKMETDTAGNIYTSGFFYYDTLDVDPGPATYTLASGGTVNSYLTKWTPSGNFIWAKHQYTTWECSIQDLFVKDTCVYGAGYFRGNTDFDHPSAATFSANAQDAFVMKIGQTASTTTITSVPNQLKTLSVELFPNPSDGNFLIKGAKEHTLIIYDALGKEIFRKIIENYLESISISENAGIYFYSLISTNNTIQHGKILIGK